MGLISSEQAVALGDATRDTVENRFQLSRTMGVDAYNQAIAVLQPLLEVLEIEGAMELINAGLGEIIFNHIENIFPLDIPAVPARPNFEDIFIDPALSNLDVPYIDTQQEYQSQLLNAIVAKLVDDVQSGGTGLTAEVQAADQALAIRRQEEETQKLMDNAAAVYESMGWRIPPGAVVGLRQEAANQAARNNMDSSDRLLHETFNLALQNKWKAIEAGVTATKAQMDYVMESAKLGVLRFQAGIERVKAIIQLNLGIAQVKSLKNENLTKLYTAEVAARDTVLQGVVKAFDVLVRQSEAEANLLLKKKQVEFDGAVQVYGIQKDVVKAIATILSQLCAAWVGSVSAGESISFNESRSVGNSEAHNWNNNLTGGWAAGWSPQ